MTNFNKDVSGIILFGMATCANLQGICLGFFLLRKKRRVNLVLIFSNVCLIICSIMVLKYNLMDCFSFIYTFRSLEIASTLLTAQFLILRSFKSTIKVLKVAIILFDLGLFIFSILVLINSFQCTHKSNIISLPSNFQATSTTQTIFLVLIYIISIGSLMSKCSKMKGNNFKIVSLYTLTIMIFGRLLIIYVQSLSEYNITAILAIESNLVVTLMGFQLLFEIDSIFKNKRTRLEIK
eukprot:NODE_35_length_36362_cov_0.944434.p22 type:complete len:237 gc:universal NODE_35_length_36362_cov_0.944434:13540-12830(-)